ncbi:hypothetical protein CTI12_AA448180 [Artemisia annua]|uniref:Peptidase C1A papain C-terminal domain-containing protein n=1 Tax=Artemisia annua TaxID=35608 RepID=A0A2U1LTG6_ARTAN|nr:hypothetical protein CTI12_AA448180 [Artemisia annua]
MEGSCKQHTLAVTAQLYENHCHLLAMADMTGTVLRMSGVPEYINLYLSCMPMVDGCVTTVTQSIAYCTQQALGLETKETYPYERTTRGIKDFNEKHYQREWWKQRYRISRIDQILFKEKEQMKIMLTANFGPDGKKYPCVGILCMGKVFIDGEYARRCAVNNEPYKHPEEPKSVEHAVELYGPEHSVLIVGVNTLTDGKHYCEIKNTYGEEWGDCGFSKVGFEVFNSVLFPTLELPVKKK